MKLQIAVIGGHRNISPQAEKAAGEIGAKIAAAGHAPLTGAAPGVGAIASAEARKRGGLVVGISPEGKRHEKGYAIDSTGVAVMVKTGAGYKGRNVTLVRSADAVVMIGGKIGTLNEATIAVGEVVPLVTITGTGGATEMMAGILEKLDPSFKYFRAMATTKGAVEELEKMVAEKESAGEGNGCSNC
ncbi:MAG: hypothetical protein AABW54_00540 [Candidatus Micrarchaeota archaeon]